MNRILRSALAAASCALVATLAHPFSPSPEEHVGVNAERGDPARWYVPADTPRLKYETQVKEAHAALGEALKECRAARAGRACIEEANAQHRRDMDDARGLFAQNRGGAARGR
jgi:hypothetical protein